MPAGKAKEGRAFISPSRYIQGPGEINNLPKFASSYGDSVLVMIDKFFYDEWSVKFEKMFTDAGFKFAAVPYPGAPTDAALTELYAFCDTLDFTPSVVVGFGGGACCDIAKVLGAHFNTNWFSCPTALTTDAPTSQHTVMHNPGEQPELRFHYKNPDYVVVDTEVTITAPAFMLVSGIGDALATYFECMSSNANNNVVNAGRGEYKATMLGKAAAKLCYEVLIKQGPSAIRAAKSHLRTPAYEDIVEATVLLSGLGFENTGVSLAHGLEAGFHVLPLPKPLLHGTGVGYSTLVELIVENKTEEFEEVFAFAKEIGLPVCTWDLGLTPENRDAAVNALVDDVYAKRWQVMNVPFFYNRSTLIDAINYLDAYAEEHK